MSLEEAANNIDVKVMITRISQCAEKFHYVRAAKLWFQYLCMVETIFIFIRVERTENFNLLLQGDLELLLYYAAFSHDLKTQARKYMNYFIMATT